MTGFVAQLGALRRARHQVSDQYRRESARAWWTRKVLLWVAASGLIFGSFILGLALGLGPEIDPGPATVLFALAPFTATGYILLIEMRDGTGGHPLGEVRARLPLSLRRSGALAVCEDTLGLGTLFVWVYGIAPWAGAALTGQGQLNAVGWVGVALLPFAAVAWKEVITAFQVWLLAATTGPGAAMVRVGLVVAIVLTPAWLERLIALFGPSSIEMFDLPMREWLRNPVAIPAIVASVPVLLVLAVWMRTWPPLRIGQGWSFWNRKTRDRRFSRRTPVRAMTQMMLVQAVRSPSVRYAAVLLGIVAFMLFWVPPRTGIALVAMTAFVTPMSGFFNLYGWDSRYYHLWLASGRTLSEWTVAREMAALVQFVVFGYAGGIVLGLHGVVSRETGRGLAALPLACIAVGLWLGPTVSRFVATPQDGEVGVAAKKNRSSRAFLPPLLAAVTGAGLALVMIPVARAGFWWADWVLALGLLGAALAPGTHRGTWTPGLRERFAVTFR